MINRKICLVGIGKFGKKYFHEIINFKNLHLSCILRKNLNQLKYKSIPVKKFNYNLKLDKFDLAVIASPVESHYINAQYFLSKNIPIILEKPATRSLKEINKLILISKKNKVPVLVHHSDLYNKNFIKLSNIKRKIGKIKKLIIVKLNGWNENTVRVPIKNGIKYKIKKRLLKYFSNIIECFLNNFSLLYTFF